jgi:hypothetical protein
VPLAFLLCSLLAVFWCPHAKDRLPCKSLRRLGPQALERGECRSVPSNPFFPIRATRADPPGQASIDEDRRATYGAALSQFDELMATAQRASARSRPLPLFYAISQAGRAVSAAHSGEVWKLRGHGLSAPGLDVSDIRDVEIKPAPSSRDKTVDSFQGVATACGSELPCRSMSVGELWSTLPGVYGLLGESSWPQPLVVSEDETDMMYGDYGVLFDYKHMKADLSGVRGDPAGDVGTELARYPAAAGAKIVSSSRSRAVLAWPTDSPDYFGWRRTLERVAPPDPLTGTRWLRPAVAGGDLNALMTWWALLYGLSMVARYEPGAWVRALDLDRPGLAAQLTELMDIALEAVPLLVFEALTRDHPGAAVATPT